MDANAAGLREISGRAARARQPNLLYVRAAVEDLPSELTGVADRIMVVLPWGSLLAAVARPVAPLLGAIRRLGQPRARLTVVWAIDPERDRTELVRLGLTPPDAANATASLAAGYAEAGFTLVSARRLTTDQLAAWPSTWAKTLAHGRARAAVQIEARGTSSSCSSMADFLTS